MALASYFLSITDRRLRLSSRSWAGFGAVFVHVFMIAVRRYLLGVSTSPTRYDPPQYKRDHPGFGVRSACSGDAQRKLVSDCQRRWSKMASLRATATLARFPPLVAASARPQVCRGLGRLTLESRLLAAS